MKIQFAGLALATTLALAVVSCDSVEGMRDMKDAQDQLKGMIEEAIGVEALVGFNLSNGEVIDVSIAFSASDVNDRSVSELVRAARAAVAASFANKPRVIYIELAASPDQ